MKAYFVLTMKRAWAQKINRLPLLLGVIAISVLYWSYYQGTKSTEQILDREVELMQVVEGSESLKLEIATMSDDDPAIESYRAALAIDEFRIEHLKGSLDAKIVGNQESYYEHEIALMSFALETAERDKNTYGDELISALTMQVNHIEYLKSNNLEFEFLFFPIAASTFAFVVQKTMLPMLLLLALYFCLANVFSQQYRGNIDKNRLISLSGFRMNVVEIGSGFVIASVYYSIFMLYAALLAAFANRAGTLLDPILTYMNDGTAKMVPVGSLIAPLLILTFVSFLLSAIIMVILKTYIRDKNKLFIVTSVLCLGLHALFVGVAPLYKYAHLFPLTYLNPAQIVNGGRAFQLSNSGVNGSIGFLVSLLSIAIFVLLLKVRARSDEE